MGVLVRTNDEAAQAAGALARAGIPARLIQSVDGFRFSDLAAVRYFLQRIDRKTTTPVIGAEAWDEAKEETLLRYADSACISAIREFFRQFEGVRRIRYRSDLQEFAFESRQEDFCVGGKGTVFVSTIHKAKGREFDTVYMLLRDEPAADDDARRKLYVGITRARNRLYIHCNTGIFGDCRTPGARFLQDDTPYPEPPELTLQLSLKDVWLDFSKNRKKDIFHLRSGGPLAYDDGVLVFPSGVRVARLSKAALAEVRKRESRGYAVREACVGFIVAWKGKDATEESAILLPVLTLRKA